MNEQTPHLKCRLVNLYVSFHADFGGKIPACIQRHRDACPACRAHAGRQDRLIEMLTDQAPAAREAAPIWLKPRVMAAWREVEGSPAPRRAFSWRPAYVCAAAAMVVLIAGFWTWRQPDPKVAASADLKAMTSSWLSEKTNSAALLGVLNTAMEQPLEKEMQLVIADAKSALYAVASGVLPATVLGSDGPSTP